MDRDDDFADDFRDVIHRLRLIGEQPVSVVELPLVAKVDLSDLPPLSNGQSLTVTSRENWT